MNFSPATTCLYVANIFVWLGIFIGAKVSFPNCPSELYPKLHILPSPFNTAAYPSPPATCGAYFIPSSITSLSKSSSFFILSVQSPSRVKYMFGDLFAI